jgi:hypothetical protein
VTRWYRAARFPLAELAAAGRVYYALEAYLTGPARGADVYGCRVVDPGEAVYVVVIADGPDVFTPAQLAEVERMLAADGEAAESLDGGMLDAMYATWAEKRGKGPPIVTRGQLRRIDYRVRGPERPA